MIYLGSDHGGFALKEKVKQWLSEWNYPFKDMGATRLDEQDDYPQYAFAVSEEVGNQDRPNLPWKDRTKGILVCRSSGGVVVAANKVKGVRAVAAWDDKSAEHARLHNDANVIALAGDWTNEGDAKKIIKKFLETEFSGEERHKRRIAQITAYEEMTCGGCGGGCCGGDL